jgi:hypothetical protein
MSNKLKWEFQADYLQACNCDYGCPCEFSAPPTHGSCEGGGAWRINRGQAGEVRLDGLGLGFVARWPKAMHLGNGVAQIIVDERATPPQREALLAIASGQAGGAPFEIIATTFSKVLDPMYARFEFQLNGGQSGVKIGNVMTIQLGPIKNPVTGDPESVRVQHSTGFIFKEAECLSTDEFQASAGEMTYNWPKRAGFVAKVKYGN